MLLGAFEDGFEEGLRVDLGKQGQDRGKRYF